MSRFARASGLDLQVLPAGAVLFRVHHASADPTRCGPLTRPGPADRSDRSGGAFSVLQLAGTLEAAFATFFLRRRARLVARAYARERMFTALSFSRPLRLARVAGSESSESKFGDAYSWTSTTRYEVVAKAFGLSPEIDGLVSLSAGPASSATYVLFERAIASAAIRTLDTRRLDIGASQVEALMRLCGAAWDESPSLPPEQRIS